MEQTVNYWLLQCVRTCTSFAYSFHRFHKSVLHTLKKKKKRKKNPKPSLQNFCWPHLHLPVYSSPFSVLVPLNYVLLDPKALRTMFRLQICSVPSWSFFSPSQCFKRIVTVLFMLGSSLNAFRKSFIFVNVGLMPVCMASYFAVL